MPFGKRQLQQAAQPSQVGVNPEEFQAGLLVFPTFDANAQADAPDEL